MALIESIIIGFILAVIAVTALLSAVVLITSTVIMVILTAVDYATSTILS